MSICDCESAESKGFLDFGDDDCQISKETSRPQAVTYTVFSHIPEVKKFPGHTCSTWTAYKSVLTDFLGWQSVKQWRHPLETSIARCKKMRDSRICGETPMTALGYNRWSLEEYPDVQGSWWTTRDKELINCRVEEVVLESTCPNCTVNSPLGLIPLGANGSFTQNMITLVWEDSWKEPQTCELKIVDESNVNGLLYNTSKPTLKRLQNRETQVDFLINTTLTTFCNETLYNTVAGMDKVLVVINYTIIKNINKSPEENNSKFKYSTVEAPTIVAAEITTAAHEQYVRDLDLEMENKLATEIRKLQCDSRKAIHQNAITTAQYDGWLAASQIDLPLCHKLATTGVQVSVIQCIPKNISFETIITQCGPQPKYLNFTIGIQGWELAPFSNCYWHSNFVNFNGKAHSYQNYSWQPIFPSINIQGRNLIDSTDFEADNTLGTLLKMHPIFQTNPISHSAVMADILASLQDHYISDNSQGRRVSNLLLNHQDAPHISFMSKLGNWLKTFGAITGFGAITFFMFRFCGVGSMFLKCCPFLSKLNPLSWCSKSSQDTVPVNAQNPTPITIVNMPPAATPTNFSTLNESQLPQPKKKEKAPIPLKSSQRASTRRQK